MVVVEIVVKLQIDSVWRVNTDDPETTSTDKEVRSGLTGNNFVKLLAARIPYFKYDGLFISTVNTFENKQEQTTPLLKCV